MNSRSDGYLQTLVYQDSAHHAHFAVEGTLNSIAAALAPYPVEECRIEDMAADDIYCVAESSGLGAPYFRQEIGIRFSQPVEHLSHRRIAALLLEAVIFRVARILEDFHHESALYFFGWVGSLLNGFLFGVYLRKKNIRLLAFATLAGTISKFGWVFLESSSFSFYHAQAAASLIACSVFFIYPQQ